MFIRKNLFVFSYVCRKCYLVYYLMLLWSYDNQNVLYSVGLREI